MKKETLRKILMGWCLFIGIGAVAGSTCMFIKPDGSIMQMEPLLVQMQVLPFGDILFQDYIFSGFALFIVNGLTQLLTFFFLLKRQRLGSRFGIGCGVVLMLWICIQFVIFEFNVLSTSYFIFGLLEALTAIFLYRKENGK